MSHLFIFSVAIFSFLCSIVNCCVHVRVLLFYVASYLFAFMNVGAWGFNHFQNIRLPDLQKWYLYKMCPCVVLCSISISLINKGSGGPLLADFLKVTTMIQKVLQSIRKPRLIILEYKPTKNNQHTWTNQEHEKTCLIFVVVIWAL